MTARPARPARLIGLLACAALLATSCSVHRLGDEDLRAGGDTATDPTDTAATPAAGQARPNGASDEPGASTPAPLASESASESATETTTAAPARTPATDPPRDAPQAVARTASDRGVSEDKILLGILHTSDAFFAAAGASTKSVDRVIAPFIAEVNDAGGINGRQVVPKISTYDPLSAESMNAACVEQAEDHKVFAAIAQNGFYGDAEVCMAVKETPLLTGNNSSRKTNVERERGWVRQTHQNKDRNMVNWIDWMVADGILDRTVETGLIYVDVPEDRDLVEEVVLPYFDAKGLPRPRLATLSASIAQTPAEAQSAVLQFKANGVELVLPLVSFLRMLIFAEQATAANYHPEYTVSDFGLLATDAMAGMPPEQWEGVRGVTVLRTGINEPGQLPQDPGFQDCHRVYKTYGEDFEPSSDDPSRPDGLEVAMMMHYCQHVALWADVARRAGANPTRRSFLEAFDQTGTWAHRVVLSERLTYGPGKYDGADLFAIVQWRPNCTSSGGCYRQVEGFRAGS